MSDAPDPTLWLRELARAGSEQSEHRPQDQFAAIAVALERRRTRRPIAVVAATARLAAAAAFVVCTPRYAPTAPEPSRPFSAAASADDTAPVHTSKRRGPPGSRRAMAAPPVEQEAREDAELIEPGRPDPTDPQNKKRSRPRRPPPKAPPKPSPVPPALVPAWRVLVDGGDAAGALAAMDDAAFEDFVAAASANELLRIANAARAKRLATPARRALLTIRKRFAEHEAAQQATFLLGRVDAELSHKPKRAAQWWSRYVREYPRGPLAAQARGRLVAHHAHSGSSAEARTAARSYLDHHADGPYAGLANSILGTAD